MFYIAKCIFYLFILLIQPRIINISTDSSSLNILSLLLLHLSQKVERTNILLKTYKILDCFSFIYFGHLIQQIFFIYKIFFFDKILSISFTSIFNQPFPFKIVQWTINLFLIPSLNL